jgi:FtsP/CotA-like multicopper oxidase with cupredoxin domain
MPAVAVLLAVTGCGDGPSPAQNRPDAVTTASASPRAAGSAAALPAVDKEIVVTVAGNKVTPPTGRIEVRQAATVRITVTSDVADELHVHGYDLQATLPAGQPASIDLRADRTGLFEVETHASHLVLFQLVVR